MGDEMIPMERPWSRDPGPIDLLIIILFAFVVICGGSRKSHAFARPQARPQSYAHYVPTIPAAPKPAVAPAPAVPSKSAPSSIYGVTVDDIENLPEVLSSLSTLSRKPTVRLVFDEGNDPSYYREAVAEISQKSFVMGEILDSEFVADTNVYAYENRAAQYVAYFPEGVDIWEVGNEVNGEWLGNTNDVASKIERAYDVVKSRGKTAALTLYYNQDCWSRADHEMFTWAANNIPASMKSGLDYVLVSYYEEDCNGLRPDWQAVFTRLHAMFPNSKLGFGETGVGGNERSHTLAEKAAYLNRYYSMRLSVPNFIGGYFWWYFAEEMVPSGGTMWRALNSALTKY